MKKYILTLALVTGLGIASLAHAQTSSVTPPAAPAAAATPSAPAAATAVTPASSPAQQAQSNKMKTCAAQYHQQNIPKDQYHTFMSTCLKKSPTTGTTPAAAPATPATPPASSGVTKTSTSAATTQQDKMKACSQSAKTQSLTGDARKTFMQSCLSNN